MNKIYKVIWSKVKNQYVVVSELAHSNGKQSRTSRNSIRSRIAALVVCGAIAAFGVFSALPNSAYAATNDVGVAKESQYVAIFAQTSYLKPNLAETKTIGDYTYKLQKLDGTNNWYYVRDGYTIEQVEGKRFTGAQKTTQIQAIKSPNASTEGLLQSNRVLLSTPGQSTVLGDTLQKVDVGVYMGATNEGGTITPSSWNYYIQKNDGNYIDAGGANFDTYFVEAKKQADGTYTVNGKTVSSENLYVINDQIYKGTNDKGEAQYKLKETDNNLKLGAFVVDGQIYTKNVFGKYNEVLMSAQQGNTYYSYWAADTYDADAPMQLTQGQYKDIVDTMWGNDAYLASSDVSKIKLEKVSEENKKGGTISLLQQGDYNSETNSYENNKTLPGAITVISEGGTGGSGVDNDVKIKFSNAENTDGFTVEAGSKVEATKLENNKVSELSINGETYAIGGGETYSAGNGITIDENDKNKISVKLKDGENNLTVDDSGLSLKKDLNVTSVIATNNIAANSMSVTEVGNSDNSVVNVGYFNTNEKHIAPTENSSYEASADGTVTLKYADGEGNEIPNMTAKITGLASDSELSSAAAKATTEVVAGKNVKVTPGKDAGDQHNIYTVDAYDTKIQGDSNISVTGGELDSNNVRNYNVKLADVVTIGDSSIEGNNPVKVDGKTGEITGLTNTTLDVNGFAESNRAATEEQLQAAMQDIDEGSYKGWTVSANGENGTTVENGKTVDFSSEDGNVTVTKTTDAGNTKLAFGLADELSVNKVTTSNMYVTNVDKTNDASVVNVGYFNTNEKHIAPTENSSYEASADGTVTLKYADGEGNEIPNMTAKITGLASDSELSSAAAKATTEVVAGKNVKVTPGKDAGDQHNIYTVDAYDTKIQGDSNISVTGGELDSNNVRNYNVKLADVVTIGDSSIEGNNPVKVDGKTGEITGLTNKTLGNGGEDSTFAKVGRAATEEQLQAAMTKIDEGSYKGWNVTTNKGTKTAEVASDGNVDFSNTDGNIIVGQDGTNLTFDLNDNIILGDESGTRIQLNGNPQENSMISITNKDSDTVFNIAKDGTVHSDGDIVAKADSNKKYSLSEVGENAVRYNENKSTVALAGTNGTTITNVADGDVSEGSKEAVNGSQLYATNQKVDAGWVATDGTNKIEVNPTDSGTTTLNFAGDNNITVTADTTNKAIQVALNDKVYLGGDHTEDSRNIVLDGERGVIGLGSNIALDGRDGTAVIGGVNITTTAEEGTGKPVSTINGLSNTTWTGTTETPNRAATEGQLEDLSDTVNTGWYVADKNTAEDSTTGNFAVKPGETLTFNGDDNIDVEAKDHEVNVSLNDNITLGEGNSQININGNPENGEAALSIGDKFVVEQNGSVSIKADNTETYGTDTTVTINPDGVKFEKYGNGTTVINGQTIQAGGVVINGEDNGVYKGTITGLTNTTLDDETFATVGRAATEEQLKQAAAASKTTVSNGTNTTVTSVTDPTDGHVDYQVNLNDNVYLGGNNKPGSSNIELDGENGTIQVGSNIILDSKEARAVIGGVDISTTFDDIGKKSSTITGLSNTTWDTDKVVIDRAATEGQLQMVSDKVTAGWTATDDAGNKINVNPETRPTLNFASGKNITVSANEDSGEVEVSLNDNINLNNRVYINGDPEEGNNTIVDIKSSDTSKEESIFAVEDKGNGSISIGGIDVTNVDGPYLAVGDGKLKFYKDGGLSTGNATGTFSVRPDGDLEINGKNSSFNVDAETGNVNAINNSGSAIMMNDDSVALNASGNGVAISDEGILLNTNGINEDIKLVTKGTSVSVDSNGTTFTNTNTNETTNINGGTINVGDKLVVDQNGTTTIAYNDGSVMGNNTTMTVNKDGVSFSAYGNGTTVIDGQTISAGGVVINNNGSGTINGLTNTTWDDELAKQVANSEELQGTAATQGQLQQAVSEVAEVANAGWNAKAGGNTINVKPNETLNFEGDGNITVSATGGTSNELKFGLNDDITLGNPKAGNTEGERSFTINTTNPEGYVPESYKTGSGADFIDENGGFMLFATNTQGYGVFGVTAKGSAWAKDFKTYTTDIYGNNTQYSLNDVGDAVAQMSSYYNKENGKSYTVFSRYLNEAEKDNPFATVDENATRDIPLALRDDGAVLIGATIKGDDFTDNGIRINAETETTYDGDGNEVTNNIATITGLENTEWKPPTPVATFAANDINTTSRAATEAQLDDLYSAVAAYDVNVDGTIDYSHIALAGAPYGASRAGNGTPTGGTSITNVAYASGNDGSEAVNVDYLKDAISDAAENGSISTSDQHLVANTETGSNGVYKPNDDGNVNLIVSDEKGNSSTITIGDVASKTELDSLKTNVGDLSYSKVQGDDVKDGDSVTTAIGKLDNKIENISGTATDADNNTVTGGKINSDGTISLTQKDKDSIKLEGQLTDSGVVQEGTSFDKETGTITITSQDKYSGETSSVKVEGIASTEVVGATNKEDLATAYKDADKDGNATTEYITDSESMVEADVALDHAIQDVANTSYANDMVLSNRIDSVEKRLGNVEERIDKVGAMAAAIANLRTMGFDPEAPTEIAIGVGQYKSETGIAIGVFHYPNQDFMLSASLSSSGDELMGGIGATWKLGRKSAAERAKDEEARHLEQAEEMKKLAQQEKVKAQAQRHAKLLAERQQASQKNA